MVLKRLDKLGCYELTTLLGWGDDIFGSGEFGLAWRPKDLHLVLYIDGEPVSKCGLLRQTITVGGKQLEVAGLGGVVTTPRFQHQGLASHMLKEVERLVAAEWALAAITLFCRESLVPFYTQRGWHLVNEPVEFLQPNGKMISPVEFMYLPIAGNLWPKGEVNLASLPW